MSDDFFKEIDSFISETLTLLHKFNFVMNFSDHFCIEKGTSKLSNNRRGCARGSRYFNSNSVQVGNFLILLEIFIVLLFELSPFSPHVFF